MWVDTPKSMIQEEDNDLTKQKIHECAQVTMSEVDTECIFESKKSYLDLDKVTESSTEVGGAVSSAVDEDDPTILDN